jgi:hypothetical protein
VLEGADASRGRFRGLLLSTEADSQLRYLKSGKDQRLTCQGGAFSSESREDWEKELGKWEFKIINSPK